MVRAVFKIAAHTQLRICKPVVTRVSFRHLRTLGEGKVPLSPTATTGDWHGSLTWCVVTQTFSLAVKPAEELSAASVSPSFLAPRGQWSLNGAGLAVCEVVS